MRIKNVNCEYVCFMDIKKLKMKISIIKTKIVRKSILEQKSTPFCMYAWRGRSSEVSGDIGAWAPLVAPVYRWSRTGLLQVPTMHTLGGLKWPGKNFAHKSYWILLKCNSVIGYA